MLCASWRWHWADKKLVYPYSVPFQPIDFRIEPCNGLWYGQQEFNTHATSKDDAKDKTKTINRGKTIKINQHMNCDTEAMWENINITQR